MRRLFWRIFALFWASSVVLIVAIAWITSNNFENEKIPGSGITRLESVLNEHLRNAAHTCATAESRVCAACSRKRSTSAASRSTCSMPTRRTCSAAKYRPR
jgi:hypothetical protein